MKGGGGLKSSPAVAVSWYQRCKMIFFPAAIFGGMDGGDCKKRRNIHEAIVKPHVCRLHQPKADAGSNSILEQKP
jgi:hypothetical protein